MGGGSRSLTGRDDMVDGATLGRTATGIESAAEAGVFSHASWLAQMQALLLTAKSGCWSMSGEEAGSAGSGGRERPQDAEHSAGNDAQRPVDGGDVFGDNLS